jgi:dipeptidyl aminopeptidase/acylaminoacyl peptidase
MDISVCHRCSNHCLDTAAFQIAYLYAPILNLIPKLKQHMKKYFFLLLIVFSKNIFAQPVIAPLTVQKIMRDEKWIGTSPSKPYWSVDSKYLFFNWNPGKAISDSVYYITRDNTVPQKASAVLLQSILEAGNLSYNSSRSAYAFSKDGDIYIAETKTGKQKRITQTADYESDPVFSFNDAKIVYTRNQNLYAWDIASGMTTQLTNFQKGTAPRESAQANLRRQPDQIKVEKTETLNTHEIWLHQEQLQEFDVLRSRKAKKDLKDSMNKLLGKPKELRAIYTEDKNLNNILISPDGRFVTYRLIKSVTNAKKTIVPSYVTESGFTEEIPGRTKVGAPQSNSEFFIFDTQNDTIIRVNPDQIPGITDPPDYLKYYPSKDTAKKKPVVRDVGINGPIWSPKGTQGVVDIYSQDKKDRWLMLLDATTGKLKLLSRQRDEAWIGGPGIGFGGNLGWIDENTVWYQSEETGYSHLYKADVLGGRKTACTTGNYEVQQTQLSNDKKYFYITTNEVHPGEQQFYRLLINGSKAERITVLTGANQVIVSPDEKQIAILYSYTNKPWELYRQENKPGGKIMQITSLATSQEFQSYAWRDPELITFVAKDGALVYARLYRPATANAARPGVIFVHGAGYLQNAHKWWSNRLPGQCWLWPRLAHCNLSPHGRQRLG